jgi:hypothetical protein
MRALSAGVCALCGGELMCGEMPPRSEAPFSFGFFLVR